MTTMTAVNTAMKERVAHLERRYGRRKVYTVAGIAGVLLLLATVRTCSTRHKATEPPPPRSVTVAKVITRDVPLYLDEIGTCTAAETVQVQAQVSGQIISREFEDGADVKKGDVLFRIDARPFEAALASAQADAALAQVTLARQSQLRSKAVVAGQDYDTAQANAMKADAAVKAAQVNLDFCTIRSPIDGHTSLRNIDVGNLVGPSSPPLILVQKLDPIYTDFTIAERDIPLVRQHLNGPPLEVLTVNENDKIASRTGQLTFIDNTVQPGMGTVRARATTENRDHALWPAQFVRVRLILEMLKNAMLVPSSAVQIGQNGPYVFVVKSDSTIDLRQVKPGQKQDGDTTVIIEGVKPGETVITRGQLQLAPGMKVAVQEEDQSSNSGTRDGASNQ
jgi:membrane fusion protein, multidrug efflux system